MRRLDYQWINSENGIQSTPNANGLAYDFFRFVS
jgi:hypothetical protein